jgi:flagellar L-ring protein precursor FlgH
MMENMNKENTIYIVGLVLLFLSGCSSMGQLSDPDYEPPAPVMPEAKSTYDGGLFYASSNLYIFEDIKATRVGDLLTVVLSEETNASKSSSLDADKSATIDLPNPTLFGKSDYTLNGREVLSSSATASRDIQGEGELTQENSLDGNITVTVTERLPNGYLVIKGEKLLTLNEGSEVVRIDGMVRPNDIDSSNQIESTKIANARITYKGSGVVSDSSKAGWLSKFFMHAIWPL